MIKILKILFFRLKGRVPWSRGYIAARTDFLATVLPQNFDLLELPKNYGIGFDERVVEYPWVFSRLSKKKTRLLDAGSVLNFDYILDHHVLKDKVMTISTLAPERNCFWLRNVSYVFEDFRQTCFRDSCFDEIVCLSTLEHVGLDNLIYTEGAESGLSKEALGNSHSEGRGSFLEAISELWRILRPGGKLFLSMPFGKKMNHGWLQVFDGAMVDQIYQQLAAKNKQEWIYQYTEAGWRLADRETCKNSIYFDKHKNGAAGQGSLAAAESVICIELIKTFGKDNA